ncbi:MAG TPA: hypothetical protein VF152_08385, partial [Acidimicrobiia bacterium]
GADAWKSAAGQLEEAVDDLGDAFSKLADQVQAAAGAAGEASKKGYNAFLDQWKKARAERQALLDEG